MEEHRKDWNKQQKMLRALLENEDSHSEAISSFLSQHSVLHSVKMDQGKVWSFEDDVLNDLEEHAARRIPGNEEHSIAWCIWHIARIEDVTMNILVADRPQLFLEDQWRDRLGIAVVHTGNVMEDEDIEVLSNSIDIQALRDYRCAVGRRTQEIIKALKPEEILQKVQPDRLQKVVDEGAVVQAALGLIEYWSRRTIAGLLLMPPTRHNFVHLNEASKLKQ